MTAKITGKLNNVEPTIDFINEQENNNSLYFLREFFGILLENINNKLECSIHYKSTNKTIHIHFSKQQNKKIKRGIIIDFYLRNLRNCIPNDEFDNIENFFTQLQYPKVKVLKISKQ